ncbi:MAG: SUMF1/EgtB/PvdO family nonheme iron enzyme [Thermoguttaceae bacterium]|nr:SUMF1/EgtB/PvdO family nonheme iron enzyme [Thermoguttaceae bacterium]
MPDFYPDDASCAVAKHAKDAKNALRKAVQKICDQKDKCWDEYESNLTIHLGTSRVKTKPTIAYPEKSFPSPFAVEVSVPYVWRQDVVGVVDVEFPVLGYSTSFSSSAYLRQEIDMFLRQKLDSVDDAFIYNMKDVCNVRLDQFHVSVKPPKKHQLSVQGISFQEDGPGFYDDGTLTNTVIELTPAYIRRNYSAAWEMENSVNRLSSELSESSSSIVLVGPSSCGKSTVLVNAIRKSDYRFWLSNDRRLVQGTKWLGEWQQQVKRIIDTLAGVQGILCIENLAQLVENPDEAESSLAAFFIPFLRTKQIRMIGEMTPEEYQNMKHLLPEFIDLFEPVYVDSLSYAQGRSMLTSMNKDFSRTHGSYHIEEDVAATAAHLFHRFYGESAFPGQAAQFWRKTIPAHYRKKEPYTTDVLYDDFLTHTGMPQWLFRNEMTLSYSQIFQELSQRIIGQPDACAAVANVILRFKSAMNNSKRPIGSFLFCGPTGVGKTQMVKTMTQYLFGNRSVNQTDEKMPDRFVRLDMSEYSLPWSAHLILEKPDGSPSKLIEQVRQNPFSVVLFDEIEKADSSVFDVILNLLDEGRLQDRQGRVTNFKNTIIVMTSNLGSQSKDSHGFLANDNAKRDADVPESSMQANDGQISGTLDMDNEGDSALQNKYRRAVEQFFRPEFFNRIDNVVAFNKLDRGSSRAIVELELSALKNRTGIKERGIEIQPTPALIDKLIELGFDEQMGARPLQRIIESKVVASLAQWLIENSDENHVKLTLDWESKGVTISDVSLMEDSNECQEPEIVKKLPIAVANTEQEPASVQKTPKKQIPGDRKVETVNGVEFAFRWCPAGTFIMGSPTSEEGRWDSEKQHLVTLTKGFWMMETEITQKQWKAVMGNNPSYFIGDDLPVENVSWNDCQEFCKKCAQLGLPVQLPTEAQWEYACRAGSTTAYFWGNALNGDKANCDGNYPCGTTTKGKYLRRTTPVGSYAANAWGLYDMHGNVYEWCQDWYGDYPSGSVTDPVGPSSGSSRVIRGGGWDYDARDCRSAYRNYYEPDARHYLGFRCVRSITRPEN